MRRPAAVIRRAVVRWQTGNSPSTRGRFSEDGDTLVEVLLAIVVLGVAGLALLTAFATSITASSEHRNIASLDSSTRLAANVAIADVQQQSVANANSATNNPFRCTTSTWAGPNFSNVTGFNVTATVGYWNGATWVSTCPKDYVPQQYTLTISPSTGSSHYSTSVTTVIFDPSSPPAPNGVGTPTQLVWLQTPSAGTVGSAVTPQPEVAVEDALNNIVSKDLSSVTLKVDTGPGQFSSTCTGVESYGIVQFSNCLLNTPGTYTVHAVDSTTGVAPTSEATIVVTAASVAKLAFTTASVTNTASSTANAGPITIQEQDPFNNPTFTPVTVNLSSSSPTGVFSLTPGGAAVTSVLIPGGVTSTVSFYYGDTLAGTPTITASDQPLAQAQQNETIKPGPAAKFTLSTPNPTAGTAFNETITAFDSFGNTATSFTGTECITFSGPTNSPAPISHAPTYPAHGSCPTGTSAVTFNNGVGTPSITLYNAGSTTLAATQGSITGSATFTVASGAFASLGLTNPGTQMAGKAFNVTITGTDEYSNPISGTVSPTFSGPSNSPNGTAPSYPASVTFVNGTATASVTLYDAQSATLRVASGAINASATFTVNAGAFAGFTLSTPTPTAGTPFTETITAGDAYGNGGASFTGSQCIAFNGPTNSPNGNAPTYPAAGGNCTSGSAVMFNGQGVGTASITLFRSGSTNLTATSVSNPGISGSATFSVASAAANVFTIPTALATQTAGTPFSLGINATDTYGNPFGGTLTRTANGLSFSGPANSPAPSNTPPSYPTSLTFVNGAATASITLYDVQSTTLTVGATGATSASTPVTVTAGAASKFTLSTPTPAPTAGAQFAETITAIDGFSNIATGFTGTQCVALTGPANSPNGTAPIYPASAGCTNASSLTFLNGVGTAPITLTDAQSTALIATQGLVTGTSATFVVNAGSAATLTATSGANQSATTGTAFATKLVATATDLLGNPVSGVAVTFAAPPTGASATFATCTANPLTTSCTQTTGATGQATSSIFTANNTNGTYVITATAAGLTQVTFAEANKANQTITFTSPVPTGATYGGTAYTAAATASSGLPVTFTSGSPTICTSSGTNGSVFNFVGTGTCIVDANQAGSATYNAAQQVQQTFTVNKASAATTTSLNAVASPITYGSEASETFSGTVTGVNGDGNPTGTVTVQAGATTLCTDATLTPNGAFSATFSCPISSATLLAASGTPYSITASFGGGASSNTNFAYTTSTSTPAQNLTVNPAPVGTTTSLTVSPTTINYGSETGVTLSGTVTGVNGDGNPTGTVTVQAGATTLCTDATLTPNGAFSATFSCPISSDTLLGASGTAYSVTASFGGGPSSNPNVNYATSTSTARSLTVNPAPVATSTSLNAITSSVTYGSETSETFTGTVTGVNGDGNPTGTVTVKAGATTLCTDNTLTPSGSFSATFSCPISSDTLLGASGTAYSVTASFGGGATSSTNFTYTSSTSTPAQNLTVNAAPVATSTSLNAITSPITYNSETGTFTGTVTGVNGDGNPTGTVTVQTGTTTLCTDNTLTPNGFFRATFSCQISSTTLLAASGTPYSVTASFGGGATSNTNFTYTPSTSTAQNLTVNVAAVATSTSLTVAPTTINYGSETGVTLSGTVTGANGDGNPTGTVTVKTGTTTLCTAATLTPSGTFVGHLQLPDQLGHAARGLGHRLLGDRHLWRRGVFEHQLHLHDLDLDDPEPHGEQGSGGHVDQPQRHHLVHHLWLRDL